MQWRYLTVSSPKQLNSAGEVNDWFRTQTVGTVAAWIAGVLALLLLSSVGSVGAVLVLTFIAVFATALSWWARRKQLRILAASAVAATPKEEN